jgi:hypothetical protein
VARRAGIVTRISWNGVAGRAMLPGGRWAPSLIVTVSQPSRVFLDPVAGRGGSERFSDSALPPILATE